MSLGHALLGYYKAAWGLPDKARYGDPCNSCGMCCLASQCELSLMIFGDQDKCPAIALDQEKHVIECGLIVAPERWIDDKVAPGLRELAVVVLGAGQGCDSTHTDEDFAIHDANPDRFKPTPETMTRVKAAIESLKVE